jgi:orotidine-5'-phosphate decarboxylase
MPEIDARKRLIFALDVSSLEQAQGLVHKLDGVVSFYKIGLELQMVAGLEFVKGLLEKDKKVFLDLKYFDVDATVQRAVARVAQLGVSFLTVHGVHKTIQAAVKGRGHSALKILAVTVLTSLDASDILELGYECSVEELVSFRAKKALESGCDGVVASGREASAIRELAGGNLVIVTPGIRLSDASKDEHKRSFTPAQAIEAGADYLVVGRPIRDAEDPAAAAKDIIEEMQKAFDER